MSIISLVAVYSSIGRTAIENLGISPTMAFLKHFAIVVGTYVVVVFISNFNYRTFSRISQFGYLLSIGLLVFVLATGGQRWISIPLFGQFQPSEVAKVVLVVFVARMLALNQERIDTLETFLKLLFSIGLIAGLIVLENLSTAILVFFSCYLLMYIGGVNKKYWFRTLFIALGIVVIGLLVLSRGSGASGDGKDNKVEVGRSLTWGHRVDSWLHPDHDALTQENMARMAVARGKVFGVGPGKTVHARLMTQADNDFIYAIIIEETGMVGGLFILALYSVFYLLCIKLAKRCKGRKFGSLMVVGFGTTIYLQALINMSVAVGALPVTGQTLPFISYGGTAYIFMGIAMGIIQAVACDNIRQEKKEQLKIDNTNTINNNESNR